MARRIHTQTSESYLICEGRLTKADGTAYANADEVALTDNAIMHLFSRIEYHLSNQLIESLVRQLPLKHIFGFCEDYDKFVYGLKHSLTLDRKTDDDAILEIQQLMLEKSV